jgi:uncharacterized caspase-like protein
MLTLIAAFDVTTVTGVGLVAAITAVIAPWIMLKGTEKSRRRERAEIAKEAHQEREQERAEAREVAEKAERIRRDERLEDLERQEQIRQAAELAAERVSEVAEQATETAALLVQRQDAAQAAAEQAARDLIAANARLSHETVRAASRVNAKLDQIHTLVNSQLTAALDDRLTALNALVVALRMGADQSPEAQERIESLERTAIELGAQLADRQRQTKVADAQIEQGDDGGLRAEWPAGDEPAHD